MLNVKALAEKFRAIADDKVAVTKLADETKAANPGDAAAAELCDRFKRAADGPAVRLIADETRDKP